MSPQQQVSSEVGELDYSHRSHTRGAGATGFQTAGIIDDAAGAIGDAADWGAGLPADALKGVGSMTGDAWDWGVGGTADATEGAWDWAVGGTADATEDAWDWAAGGSADATEEAWDWAAGGAADAATPGGGGGNQNNQSQSGSGSLLNPTTMMIGGAAILGLGGAYYVSQR